MHSFVGVIVDVGTEKEVVSAAEALLDTYSMNKMVPAYKEYPDTSYVRQLLKNYKVKSLTELEASSVDWRQGEEGGIDEKGLYFMTTQNPQGTFDYWSLVDGPFLVEAETLRRQGSYCTDVITPDGQLTKGPLVRSRWRRAQKLQQWEKQLAVFEQQYSGMKVCIFDCHS